MEAIYDDMPFSLGFGRFAPLVPARGAMFSARRRLGLQGEPALAGPAGDDESETDYGG
jgi:hypothetical protein